MQRSLLLQTAILTLVAVAVMAVSHQPVLGEVRTNEDLIMAARDGNSASIKELLAKAADAGFKSDWSGYTPLHVAAECGRVEAAKVIVSAGVKVDAIDSSGCTPLMCASALGRTAVAALLLSNGANVNAADKRGYTALHWACEEGRPEIVKLLISKGADPNARDKSLATPLHLACVIPRIELLRTALCGTKLCGMNTKTGYQPLLLSSPCRHRDYHDLLLAGAGRFDVYYNYPFSNADEAAMQALLGQICAKPHAEVVKLLLAGGADASAVAQHGRTPLSIACREGLADVAALLIDSGAKVDQVSTGGQSPLQLACGAGNRMAVMRLSKELLSPEARLRLCREQRTDLVKLLVSKGADVNSVDTNGYGPLHAAARWNHIEVVNYLIRKGANAEATSSDGTSPLMGAVSGHSLAEFTVVEEDAVLLAVDALIRAGADVNARTVPQEKQYPGRNGPDFPTTSLGWAKRTEQARIEDFLRDHGATAAKVTAGAEQSRRDAPSSEADDAGQDWRASDRSPVHRACARGDANVVSRLLKEGADVSLKDGNGNTPLHLAARGGNASMVKLLLDKGSSPNANNATGATPLHWAVLAGDPETLKLLLLSGATINAKTVEGETPLHFAARWRDVGAVKALLDAGADAKTPDKQGMIPLHRAAEHGDPAAVELLLAKGTDVDAAAHDGTTPLMSAAARSCFGAMKLLLENGANITRSNKAGQTALALASLECRPDVIRLLLSTGGSDSARNSAGAQALLAASRKGLTETARLLLEKGADVNGRDRGDATPLIWACGEKHPDTALVLIEHGADFRAVTARGGTALIYASARGLPDVVKALLAKGDDVNGKSPKDFYKGMTPLIAAANKGRTDLVRLLLDKGADPTPRAQRVGTAADAAAGNGHEAIVKLLLAAQGTAVAEKDLGPMLRNAVQNGNAELVGRLLDEGGDVNARAGQDTLLGLAAGNGNLRLVRLLLDRGADVNAHGTRSWTPLIHASLTKNVEVVQLLLNRGAKLSEKNGTGHQELGHAVDTGSSEIVRLLLDAGAKPNDGKGVSFCLARAAQRGYLDVVKLLIDRGANVAPEGTGGFYFMLQVANGNNVDALKLILDKRKELGKEDLGTVLISACMSGRPEIVEFLLSRGADVNVRNEGDQRTPLHAAAHRGSSKLIKLLIDAGADVNARNKSGASPLIALASAWPMGCGHRDHAVAFDESAFKGVQFLIAAGADVNAADNEGRTALAWARMKGYTKIAETLTKLGAKETKGYGAAEIENYAALLESIGTGKLQAVKDLLAQGAEVNRATPGGMTPLMSACTGLYKHPNMVRLLLENKANVHASDGSGRTALMWAISNNCGSGIVRLLLEHGADANIKDKSGSTPLIVLCNLRAEVITRSCPQDEDDCIGGSELHSPLSLEREKTWQETLRAYNEAIAKVTKGREKGVLLWHPELQGFEIAKLLVEAGADVNARNREGKMAVALAKEKKFKKISEYLILKGAKE